MDKTKVRVSPDLLDYQITTAQWVADCREEKLTYAAQVEDDLEPFTGAVDFYSPETPGLLTPPWVETVFPVFYFLEDGEIEGLINVVTSDLFGIQKISVTIWDEAGKLLDSGYAELNEGCIGCWAYPVQKRMAPAVGTTLTIRAVASDSLGGMSIAEEKLTLTEEYLRDTTEQTERMMNK
jgi:hypothetical protein